MRYRSRLWVPVLATLVVLAAACAVEDSTDQSDDPTPAVPEQQEAPEETAFTEQDCAAEILGFGDHLDEMETLLASVPASLDAGQIAQATSDYGHLSGQVIVALDLHELWHDYCDDVLPDRAAEVVAFTENVEDLWERAEEVCRERRSDLFDC